MKIEMETHAERLDRGWRDIHGFVGPFRPGNGPRSDPRGEFPTGPEIGTRMPDIHCLDTDRAEFDLHQHRCGSPAIVVFHRSAVW